jgi:hypothetical protein
LMASDDDMELFCKTREWLAIAHRKLQEPCK